MNSPRPPDPRLALAHRIHGALMRELGQGIDVGRMLDDARYARDVLLVCQAYPRTELTRLGAAFAKLPRPATATAGPGRAADARAAHRRGRGDSDFDHAGAGSLPPSGLRRWFVPSNWFAR
jgi:hypothetical protein